MNAADNVGGASAPPSVVKRPWRIWTLSVSGLSWYIYGASYATEEKALAGVQRRIKNGDFSFFPDTKAVVTNLGMPCAVGLSGPSQDDPFNSGHNVRRLYFVDDKVTYDAAVERMTNA